MIKKTNFERHFYEKHLNSFSLLFRINLNNKENEFF
jgi:hypothetical protein